MSFIVFAREPWGVVDYFSFRQESDAIRSVIDHQHYSNEHVRDGYSPTRWSWQPYGSGPIIRVPVDMDLSITALLWARQLAGVEFFPETVQFLGVERADLHWAQSLAHDLCRTVHVVEVAIPEDSWIFWASNGAVVYSVGA